VVGACIDVQRQLVVHCMEVDYQRALKLALPKRGLEFEREVEIPIAYDFEANLPQAPGALIHPQQQVRPFRE